jgi:hypothetical protein
MKTKLIALFLCLVYFSLPAAAQSRIQATGVTTLCVNGATGNDANDGIAPNCKQHICAAANTLYGNWDLRNNSAFIKVAGGQSYNEQCFLGGQLTGNNLLQIEVSGYSTTAPYTPFVWTNANTCLQFGDNAEVRVAGVTFVCNTNNIANQAAVYVHNNGIFDLDGKTIFSGAGSNDTAILCDGPCIFTVANGVEIQGRFNSVVWGGRLMAGTFSGPVTFAGNPFIDQFFTLRAGSTISLGATFGGGLASAGPSLVTGNSVFNANGNGVPGGFATGTGGQVCNGYC